ncbi:MAG: ATP-dependent DNA ligase [Candidatus Melainabacteria bacterium]|nr:ATP-dependent DNA ligase [Candidatus Melainabacteria bacterium]
MEAQLVEKLPGGEGWQYEPKWDGFRCLAFRDGSEVELRSKSGQSLTRYFPEVVENLLRLKAKHFVLDGELVISEGKSFSFDKLLQRIHPAESRIRKLAEETPATYIVFDLLVGDNEKVLVKEDLTERRQKLDKFAGRYFNGHDSIMVSPATLSLQDANKWLATTGAFLDGIVAKRMDLPYQSGNRKGMLKMKRMRTADCVVGGFRYGSNSKLVGSLLLGLYDDEGELHHVGFTSSISAGEKPELTKKLEKLRAKESFTENIPGAPSRWSNERSAEWVPLKPKLIVEVRYDHFTGGRFRHGTKLLRWRPDKAAKQCTMEQIS